MKYTNNAKKNTRQGQKIIGQKLIDLKKDLGENLKRGIPTRIEIMKKHDISDNTFRKYLAQVESGSSGPVVPECNDAPTLSEGGMSADDLIKACGFCVKRAITFLSQGSITIRDVESCQRILQTAKECIYGREQAIMVVKLVEDSSGLEQGKSIISGVKGANPESIKTLEDLYGFTKRLQ